jgi:hypothetical protein
MRRRLSLSGDHLDLPQVYDHFYETQLALQVYFSSNSPSYSQVFLGFTQQEVAEALRDRLEEHDRVCSLTILTAIEAFFRIDYEQRVFRKMKDKLSQEFRKLDRSVSKRKSKRASLEEEIFEAWKKHSGTMSVDKQLLVDLKVAFRYRHWLAHGRYWKPKLGRKHDFGILQRLADNVLTELPLILE